MLKQGSLTRVEVCQTDLLSPAEALPCLLSHQSLEKSLPVFGVPGLWAYLVMVLQPPCSLQKTSHLLIKNTQARDWSK